MKNLAVITLLLLYTASQVGSILVYYHRPVIHALSIYRQQRRMRGQKEIVRDTVINTKVYLANRYEENEIIFNGIFHDIRKLSITKDGVHLQFIEDRKETKLINNFSNLLEELNNPHPKKLPIQLWSWLFKVYPCDTDKGEFSAAAPKTVYDKICEPFLLRGFLTFPTQPPDNIA